MPKCHAFHFPSGKYPLLEATDVNQLSTPRRPGAAYFTHCSNPRDLMWPPRARRRGRDRHEAYRESTAERGSCTLSCVS